MNYDRAINSYNPDIAITAVCYDPKNNQVMIMPLTYLLTRNWICLLESQDFLEYMPIQICESVEAATLIRDQIAAMLNERNSGSEPEPNGQVEGQVSSVTDPV